MSRESLLALLLPLYGVPLLWLGSLLATARSPSRGMPNERAAWRALWSPLWLPGLLACVIAGWGIDELVEWIVPDGEVGMITLRPLAALLSIPLALLVLRALLRAGLSLLGGAQEGRAAVTLGLLRPRPLIDPDFAASLNPAEHDAVLAHELAHARHRDPLRIWLAQLATDLQWPSHGAARRFADWRDALELARDAEARRAGIDGVSLARAILAAARFAPHDGAGSSARLGYAGIEHSGAPLRHRIDSLLSVPQADTQRASTWLRVGLVTLALAGTVGFLLGESLFKLLPGVWF